MDSEIFEDLIFVPINFILPDDSLLHPVGTRVEGTLTVSIKLLTLYLCVIWKSAWHAINAIILVINKNVKVGGTETYTRPVLEPQRPMCTLEP